MIIVQGYSIDTQSPAEIESCLIKMQNKIRPIAVQAYHKQLSEEIEQLVDEIALNIQPRPENMTILEAAQQILNNKIAYATAKQNPTPYNYHVSVNVMFADEKTYLKFNANHNIYKKALSEIQGLHPYYLDDSPTKKPDLEKEGTWKFLMNKYAEGPQPFFVQLFPDKGFEINEKMLKFRTPGRRANIIVRHTLSNRYLSMIAGEREIPNYKMMQYMDETLEMLTSAEGKSELQLMEADLNAKNLLPNITVALIKTLPGQKATEEEQESETENEEEKANE